MSTFPFFALFVVLVLATMAFAYPGGKDYLYGSYPTGYGGYGGYAPSGGYGGYGGY